MDGHTEIQTHRFLCVLQDFVSFGPAAQKGAQVAELLLLPKSMVSFITALTHQHAAWVAATPALFSFHNTRTSSVQFFFSVCIDWVNWFIFSWLTRSFRAKSLIFGRGHPTLHVHLAVSVCKSVSYIFATGSQSIRFISDGKKIRIF